MHALKGLATSIATHIDVMNNPRRGARKLNPRFHLFSVTIKISVHIVSVVYAISRRNGTEPARNIPQDAKTRNDRFYNCNRLSGRFVEGARGL